MVYEDKYDYFPPANQYYGKPENYLAFLVFRFYDDLEDFKVKLRSMFPYVKVIVMRKRPQLWEKVIVLKNTVDGQVVELSRKDDPFTTAIKMFRVVGGVEWLQNPIFREAFEKVIPFVLWYGGHLFAY